jgi:hypothetical protein
VNGGGGSNGNGGGSGVTSYVPVSVTPSSPLPPSFNGQNVRVDIVTASSSGPVLTVPVAAVFSAASGQTEVSRIAPDGAQSTVVVSTGLSGNGYVQVTPAQAGALREGDKVVVGN